MSSRIPPPWKRDPKLVARFARLHRLRRNGTLKPMTKAEMRELAQQAAPAAKPTS